MSQDAMTRLSAALKTDETFREEFLAARSFDEAVVTATRHDCAVTIEDLRGLTGESGTLPQGALSDAELDGVGGGENLLLAAWNTVVSKLKDVKGGQTGTVEQTRNGIQNQSIRGLRS